MYSECIPTVAKIETLHPMVPSRFFPVNTYNLTPLKHQYQGSLQEGSGHCAFCPPTREAPTCVRAPAAHHRLSILLEGARGR